jgi:hypothetical protein
VAVDAPLSEFQAIAERYPVCDELAIRREHVDRTTLVRGPGIGLHFLENCLAYNNSFEYFRERGDQIVTGPTHTNLMDRHIPSLRENPYFLLGNP